MVVDQEGWGVPGQAGELDESMKPHVYKEEARLEWEPHPLNRNVKLKFLLTKKDDAVEITALLATIPHGETIPEHTHKEHDIIYPLKGRGKIWVKGLGDLALVPGTLLNVPPETPHKIYKVEEDLLVYDVFSGAIL